MDILPLIAAAKPGPLQELINTLLHTSYNQKVIFLGVVVLGAVSGLTGTFLLFRKRSLLSDTVSHATLPGIAVAYLIGEITTGNGKQVFPLMIGAFIAAWLSMQLVRLIRRNSRLKDDVALAITLAFFYGIGIVLLSVIQKLPSAHSSGLEYYLYGMVAAMVISDAYVIIALALTCLAVILLFFKEFSLLCFDARYAQTQGFPAARIDVAIMTLSVLVAVVGLQTVGLLLIMALLIIPAVSARFWTHSLHRMLVIAAVIGGGSALVGAVVSSAFPRLPAGGAIVLATTSAFIVSLLFGSVRGWVTIQLHRMRLQRQLREVQLLRAVFDTLERQQQIRLFVGHSFDRSLAMTPVRLATLVAKRDWTQSTVMRAADRLRKRGLLTQPQPASFQLTNTGLDQSIDSARNHRLTELYLLNYADVAPQNVHQHVEEIEEVTTPEIAADLRSIFHDELQAHEIPQEPHEVSS
ncbi:MAG: iron chelate uptake ABC transporter family permease subunit [Limisphaerales bacterium]